MKKSLIEWKKEIDAWIAKWRSDIKAGRYYSLDNNFMNDIKNEVKKEKIKSKKINFLFSNKKEWILV